MGNRPLFGAWVFVVTGMSIIPLFSHAFLPQEIQKIHDESEQQREERREQFRQNVLEKRKEVFSRWYEKKEEFRDKFQEEQERIKSDFELRRTREEEMRASISSSAGAQQYEMENGIFSAIKQKAQDIIHALSLTHLFGK